MKWKVKMETKFIPKIAIIGIFIGTVMLISHYVPRENLGYWFACTFVIGLVLGKILRNWK